MSLDRIAMLPVFFTKLSFIVFMVRWLLLLSYFLLVEDYELSQSTHHLVRVQLTVEYDKILSCSISSFYINCLLDDVLCKIAS